MATARLRVQLLPLAERDLSDVVAFVAAESPSAGLRLADSLEAAIARLGTHPHIGRLPRDARLLDMGYRVLIVDDYLVFYVITHSAVVVHRILHGARDFGDLL